MLPILVKTLLLCLPKFQEFPATNILAQSLYFNHMEQQIVSLFYCNKDDAITAMESQLFSPGYQHWALACQLLKYKTALSEDEGKKQELYWCKQNINHLDNLCEKVHFNSLWGEGNIQDWEISNKRQERRENSHLCGSQPCCLVVQGRLLSAVHCWSAVLSALSTDTKLKPTVSGFIYSNVCPVS